MDEKKLVNLLGIIFYALLSINYVIPLIVTLYLQWSVSDEIRNSLFVLIQVTAYYDFNNILLIVSLSTPIILFLIILIIFFISVLNTSRKIRRKSEFVTYFRSLVVMIFSFTIYLIINYFALLAVVP